MSDLDIGKCACCDQTNYLTPDGYCYTCDAEIYHDLVLSREADEQEAVMETERFD